MEKQKNVIRSLIKIIEKKTVFLKLNSKIQIKLKKVQKNQISKLNYSLHEKTGLNSHHTKIYQNNKSERKIALHSAFKSDESREKRYKIIFETYQTRALVCPYNRQNISYFT